MPWGIPDKGDGQNDLQSIIFKSYFDALLAGIDGVDCVLAGCACTPQGSPDMTVAVAKGAVLTAGVLKPVTAGNVTITTADGSNPRIDLIVVNSSGTKAVRAGTAAAAPKPPTRSANDVVLAVVYVPASDTTISSAQIVDLRVLRTQGPICIYKTTAAETTNNTSSAIHALNKATSGVTIPNGLFLGGRQLRVHIGGNMLHNSGTPTTTIAISYGGTTFFSDVTAAAAADADRRAFSIDFVLVAQASNDQALVGNINIEVDAATITAPTTGIAGEIGGTTGATASIIAPFQGAAGTIDSDAADRVLAVTVTFNVANAADELVVETATVELI